MRCFMLRIKRCLIPDLCRKNRISQTDLASKLKMTPQQISDYSRGRFKPNIEIAKNIALVLHCTTDELFEWEHFD